MGTWYITGPTPGSGPVVAWRGAPAAPTAPPTDAVRLDGAPGGATRRPSRRAPQHARRIRDAHHARPSRRNSAEEAHA